MESQTVFDELAAALRQRLAVISDSELRDRDPAAHLEGLKRASERIVTIQKRLPEKIDPNLRHYLDRCSYDKALGLLEATRG